MKKGQMEHLLVDPFLSRWGESKEEEIEFMFQGAINNNLEYLQIQCDTFINIFNSF